MRAGGHITPSAPIAPQGIKKMAKEIKKETAEVTTSDKKAKFEALIEKYKVQNPVKYAAKKAELEKKLAAL